MSEAVRDKVAKLNAVEKRALLARLIREKANASDPRETPVHRMIEQQAERTPRASAIGFEGLVVSYEELNARANRLAHALIGLGVGPEMMVGLCLDRGVDMVVGLLGILKAGAAYVPLDPAFPVARLSFMLADARLPVLVTESSLLDRLGDHESKAVCLDKDETALAAMPATNPAGGASADDLAYVIYTSGSTGTPKGVLIPHRALTNFLLSMQRQPGLTADDVLLAVTTLSFDIAALELLLPLTVGARVEIASRELAIDGARLASTIDERQVTVMQATPATWRLLLESGWQGKPDLSVLCGGEPLHRELAERLLPRAKAVWNLYGPTETTIWSTLAKIESGAGIVPIGRPIANTKAYILDALMRPVPVGLPGELYLGGLGLARGYHERPELTAERFLPDPFANVDGARIYRTGDLAKYLADGSIECMGRLDGQVKIRGYRVELGEVESSIASHPAVREAAAVARDDASGEKRLIGYIVLRGSLQPPDGELRNWLRERLPEYMIPSAFLALESLPLTPNGKLDRKALPDPVDANPTGMPTPPRGPVEEALVATWSDLLGRDGLSVHDDFFEVGGHSLLAAQLIARVRETFGVEIPIKSLFDSPTIAALGRQVEDALRTQAGVDIPSIAPIPRDKPIPASFAQQRLWFLDQLEPGSSAYNVPVTVRLQGEIDRDALGRAYAELIRRQESLRTTFASEGGNPIQVIAPHLDVELSEDDLQHLPPSDREQEALLRSVEEAWRPFDLARGPLVRARLFRISANDHFLTVVTHHVISDGWSIGVLIHEMSVLYQAFSKGEPSPLPEIAVQYADYAAWQRAWLQGDVLEAQETYWREMFSGLAVLELPTDRPRPANPSGGGAQLSRVFPKALQSRLKALGKEEGATLFMTLLAGFQAILSRYSGQSDFAIGAPIAGRTWSETEGLIGYFSNTLAFRADLGGEPSFRELLRRSRKQALEAYAHQDLPFDHLVTVLHPERDRSRAPIFQVMLVLQNAPLPSLATAGLELTPVEVLSRTSKFDMTLGVTETPEGLRASLEYATDLFDAPTIDRFLNHFEILLDAASTEPDEPVARLSMLTDEERRWLLDGNESTPHRRGNSADQANTEQAVADLDDLSDEELDALINRL